MAEQNLGKVAVTAKGEWSYGTLYQKLDSVYYADCLWMCLKDNTQGVFPFEDESVWMLCAGSKKNFFKITDRTTGATFVNINDVEDCAALGIVYTLEEELNEVHKTTTIGENTYLEKIWYDQDCVWHSGVFDPRSHPDRVFVDQKVVEFEELGQGTKLPWIYDGATDKIKFGDSDELVDVVASMSEDGKDVIWRVVDGERTHKETYSRLPGTGTYTDNRDHRLKKPENPTDFLIKIEKPSDTVVAE